MQTDKLIKCVDIFLEGVVVGILWSYMVEETGVHRANHYLATCRPGPQQWQASVLPLWYPGLLEKLITKKNRATL